MSALDASNNLTATRVVEALARMPEFEQEGGFIEAPRDAVTSGHEPRDGRLAKAKDDGEMLVGTGTEWVEVDHNTSLMSSGLPGASLVRSADDLPDASGGVRTLEDNTAYIFTSFVADTATLRLGDPSPLLAWFGSNGGYIHVGGSAAIRSNGEPFMMRDFYAHAPGGTLFDLAAPNTTEMYVIDSSFSDEPSLGNMVSLGTLDGYRVQTFKNVNFENFDAGLTLTGDTEKTFFQGCPFRKVTASGVTVVEADANYSSEILKFSTDCYVKDVQADTEVLRADPGATISEYVKYYNVDHDESVTKDNILVGAIGEDQTGVIVRNSFPLADSKVRGELNLVSGQTPQTGSATGTAITDGTFSLNAGERVSSPSAGVVQYDAEYDRDVRVVSELSVTGANTAFEATIQRNGSRLTRSRRTDSTSGASKPTSVRTSTVVKGATSDTPDRFSVYLENTGGADNLDVIDFEIEVVEI